jgi:hypothetical protein
MKKVIVFGVAALLVFLWNIAVWYVDDQLEKRDFSGVYDSCHKIWSSRGLYNTRDERNSITAFERAFGRGANGAEVDFHYDVKSDRFIISHGHPKKDANGDYIYPKKEGRILTLEALFKAAGEGHYFCLDYKNLEHLTAAETEQAINRLLSITEDEALRDRLYIEASNPLALSEYTDAGFKTILGIHPLNEKNIFSSVVVNAYKIAYCFNHITAVAMPYGSVENPVYGKRAEERFGAIPVFLFHVPAEELLLNDLMHKNSVRVILAGRDKSIDRFAINNCGE